MYLKRLIFHKLLKKEYPNVDSELAARLLDFATVKIIEWTKKEDANLILNIRGFGKFYWRKRKIQKAMDGRKLRLNNPDCQEFVKRSEIILEKYKAFESKKQEVRKLNYGDDYKTPEELKQLKLEKLSKLK